MEGVVVSDDALRFAQEWTFCMDGTSESCRTIDTPCGPCSIARALLAAHEEIERLRDIIKLVPSRTKHGPFGKGGSGPCDPDCLKCRAEGELRKLAHPERKDP